MPYRRQLKIRYVLNGNPVPMWSKQGYRSGSKELGLWRLAETAEGEPEKV